MAWKSAVAKKKKRPPPKKGAMGETSPTDTPKLTRTPVSAGGKTGITKTAIEVPPVGEEDPEEVKGSWQYLRFSAGVYYTTATEHITTAAMAKHPVYSVVPRATLERWCTEDKWVDRRIEQMERWRRKIENAVADELARTRIAQLKGLESVYDKALKKLEENLVEAKSWEGVATALVKIAQLMDEWREKIGGTVVSVTPATPDHGVDDVRELSAKMKSRLTEQEARELALMVMQKRREEMRRRAVGEEEPEGSDG